jgi:hypothetical protein
MTNEKSRNQETGWPCLRKGLKMTTEDYNRQPEAAAIVELTDAEQKDADIAWGILCTLNETEYDAAYRCFYLNQDFSQICGELGISDSRLRRIRTDLFARFAAALKASEANPS